jgi:hypothetical protein
MTIVTDFLDEKRREITGRLQELKPMVDEYKRLEAAAAALDGVRKASPAAASPAASPARPRRRGPGRPRGSANRAKAAAPAKAAKPAKKAAKAAAKTAKRTTRKAAARPAGRRRAGRRKGSGTRAAEALAFVTGQPGITIPELAAKMGIKQNYLYRVLPGLEQEAKVTKKGRGWHPKG